MEIDFQNFSIPETKNQRKFIWKLFKQGKKICTIEIVKDFEEGELRIYQNTTKIIFYREKYIQNYPN